MNTTDEREASDIEELLPWHAAGTLGHGDAQRVEAALAKDPELARRYELVREELAQTIYLNETLGAPSPRAMAALFDQDRRRASAPSGGIAQSRRAHRGIFRCLVAPHVGLVGERGDARHPAAGRTDRRHPAQREKLQRLRNSRGAVVRRRQRRLRPDPIQPQASAADITKYLETNKLSIAAGPSAGGLYRVRIAGSKLPQADAARIIKTLQIDPVVGLIVPTK